MKKKQAEKIEEIMILRQTALAGVFAKAAAKTAVLTTQEAVSELRRGQYTISEWEGITEEITKDYASQIHKGGSLCIERIAKPAGDGHVAVSTKQTFIPWLTDMREREAADIIKLIAEAEANQVHPKNIAKQLNQYFTGTKHSAITAARTEAQKIRSDARSKAFEKAGVKYVQYIAAMDERTRPEHAARNGKIYKHEDAPYLGEYNCRCVLVPADYKVEEKGAKVEDTHEEVVPEKSPKAETKEAPEAEVQQPKEKQEPEWKEVNCENITTTKELKEALAAAYPNITLPLRALSRLDTTAVAQNFQKAEDMRRDFPEIAKEVTVLKTENEHSYAYTQPSHDLTDLRLVLSTRWFAKDKVEYFEESYKDQVECKFFPAGTTYKDTIAHEMGHVLEYTIIKKIYSDRDDIVNAWISCEVAEEIVQKAQAELREELGKDYDPALTALSISQYANKSDSETLAEALSDYYANRESAVLLSKKIVKYAKEKYKEVTE